MFSVFNPYSMFNIISKNYGGKWVTNRLNLTPQSL